ncbi:hypothetical protein PENTCL1PPCAC_1615, partial [Pristionchus entomophagus]
SDRTMPSKDFPVRLVLEEKGGKNPKYKVAWEHSWVDADDVMPTVDFLKNFFILGITKDSDQNKIMEAMFVIENRGDKQKENNTVIWTYDEVKTKAPELLISFYEDQLKKTK